MWQAQDEEDEWPVLLQDLDSSLADFVASKAQATTTPESAMATLMPMTAAPQASQSATAMATRAAIEVKQQAREEEEEEEIVESQGGAASPELPREFLIRLQAALDSRGLTSEEEVAALAGADRLPDDVLAELGDLKDLATVWQADWREKQKERERLAEQMRRKRQKPVWRCAACGRYGCPVAPYVESYQEVDG